MRKGALLLLIGLAAVLTAACNPGVETGKLRKARIDGDVERGRRLIENYGCGSCHTIPGITGANAHVGPPLTDWSDRMYIAGSLFNTAENLIFWIQYPQRIEPGTAMPNMGVSREEAQHIAAYLFTLGEGVR